MTELATWDHAHIWHPFTHMQGYLNQEPLIITHAQGVHLFDEQGRKYFDGSSSIWVNLFGHNVPQLNQAVAQQLQKVAHSTLLGMSNVPATVLAKRLLEVAPSNLAKVFYTDNGAGAVEAAIKMALQYFANTGQPHKKRIVGFDNNYHGDSLGAVMVSKDDWFHWPFKDTVPDHPKAPYPHAYLGISAEQSLAAVEKHLAQGDVAAVIVEPIEGAGGIVVPPRGFLKSLQHLCNRYGALLIVDEVATGFGRTGAMFACTASNVQPDILCLGKGITGGYLPLAATLATQTIFDAFLGKPEEGKTFFHGHSYTGNPLGAAVALASLDLLQELLPHLPQRIEALSQALEPIDTLEVVGDIRHCGFMVGIELVHHKGSRTSYSYAQQAGWAVAKQAQALGLLFRPVGNVLMLVPPLGSTPEELRHMVALLHQAIVNTMPYLEECKQA